VLCYIDLSQQLGPDQPFYGLQAPGLEGEEQPYTRIEELATHYLDAIRAVQPEGPYHLGGWSVGGTIAFEMAHQLLRQGQEVELLALIDSYPPIDDADQSDDALVTAFALDLKRLFNLPFSDEELQARPPEKQLACLLEQAKSANALPPEIELEQFQRLLDVFKANTRAVLNYRPQVYPRPVTLFRASEQLEGLMDTAVEWGKLVAGGLEGYMMPGSHYTMIRQPHVRVLARKLSESLDRAGKADPVLE